MAEVTRKLLAPTSHPLYSRWAGMIRRCSDVSNPNYGGRGIRVCEAWTKFWTFVKDMGLPPFDGAKLERRDNNGPYCKANCAWETQRAQCYNTRRNVKVTLNGETRALKEWAPILGIAYGCLLSRLRRGWPHERLAEPAIPRNKPVPQNEPRRGDVWTMNTNNGTIVRHVRSVTRDGTVSYLNNGALFRVKKSTFRRWANCAELTSAEDWSGRS